MIKILLIVTMIFSVGTTGTIKGKVIKASDGRSNYRGRRYRNSEDLMVSSIEASSEASFQMTVIMSLEISTNMTSGNPNAQQSYSSLNFLKNNHLDIKKDISKGEGEHLVTLLKMMNLKSDSDTLLKIQSKFDTLASLESSKFLEELRKINDNS